MGCGGGECHELSWIFSVVEVLYRPVLTDSEESALPTGDGAIRKCVSALYAGLQLSDKLLKTRSECEAAGSAKAQARSRNRGVRRNKQATFKIHIVSALFRSQSSIPPAKRPLRSGIPLGHSGVSSRCRAFEDSVLCCV